MLRGNTMTLHMIKGRVAQTGNLFQYDYGQRLILAGIELPTTYEVHFSNANIGNSKTAIGDSTGVDIPDEYLLSGDPVHVWLFLHNGESDGETEYHGIIGVTKRAKPTDQAPTPVQQSVIDQAIAALNAGVAEVEDAAEEIPKMVDAAFGDITASAETLQPGSSATATFDTETKQLTFGVPKGEQGEQGEPGDPTELIDDTSTASNLAWSAQKTSSELSNLESALSKKQDKLKVTSLTQTPVASGQVIDSVGIPVYVDDVTDYSAYGITDTGWYSFVRITAKDGVAVSAQTTVTGADGYIATIGADHVDVAVRFGVAAQSKTVTIAWGSNYTESFVFRATDLAVRNLDYRSTFYIYDIADFAEWTWALTTDETIQAGVYYYTESGGEYTLATVTVGDTVPANTYYVHSKLTFSGMIRNVTYRFNEMVDCPIEIVLPEVPNDGYGAWFEIQMQYSKSVSITLTPTDNTVVIGTATTQAQTAGINVVDLQYSDVNGIKMWTLLNTHSNLPAAGGS